jgi:hypothetical protein
MEHAREGLRHEHKLRRFGRAEEVAAVAAFLSRRTPVLSAGRPSPSTAAIPPAATTTSPR